MTDGSPRLPATTCWQRGSWSGATRNVRLVQRQVGVTSGGRLDRDPPMRQRLGLMGATDIEALDHVFGALADGTRRTIFEILGQRPGTTTSELARSVPHLSRWAVMKHLQVLRDAGLVQTLPRGRQRCHFRIERTLDEARQWLAREGHGTSQDGLA